MTGFVTWGLQEEHSDRKAKGDLLPTNSDLRKLVPAAPEYSGLLDYEFNICFAGTRGTGRSWEM